MEQVSFIQGMNLGLGFNSATSSVHAPAINDVTTTREVLNAGGQDVTFRVEQVSSSKSLEEQLGVSASMSIKVAA